MEIRTILKSIFIFAGIFWLLPACSVLPEADLVEGDERERIIAAADPIADNLFLGMNKHDYSIFSRDFDDMLKKALDENSFKEMSVFFDPKIGAYVSRELDKIQTVDTLYVLTYTARFEDDEKVAFQLSLRPYEDTYQIAGLYFDSVKLRGK